MTYHEALEWLFAQTRAGAPRGLARIEELLERLGNPQELFDAVHVIGTNGKGGVVAYLEAAFHAAGLRYGATTSPHLVDFRERIRTHLGQVSESEVVEFVEWARGQTFREPMAFFDYTTGLAFRHFAQLEVEISAIEAGVGGVLDDTNVLPRVRLTVLTSVGEDHLEVLGGNVETVALDKAGAIRPGIPVVSGFEGIGQTIVRRIAAERGAPLYEPGMGLPLFDLPCEPSLKGRFQRRNAQLATAALRLLEFSETEIRQGLTQAVHPGRMHELVLGGVRVVLDGAHNPPAARALSEEFSEYHLVYGGFPRKDYRSVLGILLPKARSVRYARAGKGALKAEALQSEFEAPFFDQPTEALEQAIDAAQKDGIPVLVTGSLYLVGEVLKSLPPGG
ncbi:MAG: bifunctional folylpolyglutamate synthase/dihydrofolate synthase [Meiothermus sp.]|nr:bifunctional folylpolyglutamate synthase/dihydrofolate synthase [Meiothermus sp.]